MNCECGDCHKAGKCRYEASHRESIISHRCGTKAGIIPDVWYGQQPGRIIVVN